MIVALAAAVTFANLMFSAYRKRQTLTETEIAITRTMIDSTAIMVEMYALKNKRLPDSLQELVPNYWEEIPKDAWGNELQYIKLGEEKDSYRVGSLGADQAEGGSGRNADAWSD